MQKMKIFVMFFMLVVNCSIILARGTACENGCAIRYSELLGRCSQMYGPNAENPDTTMLEKCRAAAFNSYDRCMKNCAGE